MEKEILEIIAICACVNPNDINIDMELTEIPEWSSIIYVMVVSNIETKYDVKLTGDELFEVDTVKDLVDLVEKKSNK